MDSGHVTYLKKTMLWSRLDRNKIESLLNYDRSSVYSFWFECSRGNVHCTVGQMACRLEIPGHDFIGSSGMKRKSKLSRICSVNILLYGTESWPCQANGSTRGLKILELKRLWNSIKSSGWPQTTGQALSQGHPANIL